ncbi:MAG: lytic transglycosylase domain-containing protein [Vicinamibacterales bacterium]
MPTRLLAARGVAVCLLILASGLPASAQIFSWRAADGSLVLSNQQPGASADAIHTYTAYASAWSSEAGVTGGEASTRAEPYHDLILEHARKNGVRQSLVKAVIQVESAFNPIATSPKGAMGLMQLMPATARQFGVRNPYDPAQNVEAGVQYLKQLLTRYDNDEGLALAAYNAGPAAVDRHGQTIPPYQETKNYVVKVNKLAGQTKVHAPGTQLYRSVDLIDGRAVVKYTDTPPLP